jgi:hypothetical protein
MTDPKLEVGEAAARAPRLEHADVLLIERELDELERRCADANDPHPLMTRLWAGKAIQQLRAARAPREPLEPLIAKWRQQTIDSGGESAGDVYADELESRVGGRSIRPPPTQMQETKEDARVAPFNPRVETTGSTAESSPGNATSMHPDQLIVGSLTFTAGPTLSDTGQRILMDRALRQLRNIGFEASPKQKEVRR